LLGTAVSWAAAGAVAIALFFQKVGCVGWAGAAVVLGAAAGCAYRRPRTLVWGLRVGTDDSGWHVLLSCGWVRVRRLSSVRGPGWVSLRFKLLADAASAGPLTVTLWRRCLPAVHWRRLCVLAIQPPAAPVMIAREAA